MINKEWDEKSVNGPTPREGKDAETTALSGRENEPDSLVVINGPGGFPLLGAVAVGHRRPNPATDVGDFTIPRAEGELAVTVPERLAGQEILAVSEIPMTEGGDTTRTGPRSDRVGWTLPVSLFSGLGLATVFTLNALLSQPIAGFDYLTRRLDAAVRGESSRKQRSGNRAARQR
jgi:hypothetical protein